MFYIYHIPERNKIGVAIDVEQRMKSQNWTGFYEILETHTCEFKVSDREVELQIEYYGKRDSKLLYWQMRVIGAKADKSNNGRMFSNEERARGRRNRRSMTYEQAEYTRAQYKRGKDVFGKKITLSRLGKVFGLTLQAIHRIVNNEIYTTP